MLKINTFLIIFAAIVNPAAIALIMHVFLVVICFIEANEENNKLWSSLHALNATIAEQNIEIGRAPRSKLLIKSEQQQQQQQQQQ